MREAPGTHLEGELRGAGAGLCWRLERQGSNHEVWQLGTTSIAIPRHRELKELTALGIFRRLESELGKDWWR